MQSVEKLSLILVQTLYLYVEYRVGIDRKSRRLLNEIGEIHLISTLYFEPLVENVSLSFELFQLLEFVSVLEEGISDKFGDERREPGVGLAQPSAVSDTVGDVGEYARVHLVVIVEHVVFEYLAVQL